MRRLASALLRRLTRGQLAALGVGVLALAAVAVLVGVFARGWWRDDGGSYAPRAIVAQGHVTPPSSLFGDVVTASAAVLVDARRIDPLSVRVEPTFRPFRIRSESRRVEGHVGAAALVEVRYAIQCVTRLCIDLTAARTKAGPVTKAVRFPAALVTARARGGDRVTARVVWPPFVVHSRLSSEQAALSTPQIEPAFTPPSVSWTISPDLLGGLATGAAVLLVLAAGGLVASILLGDARRLRRLRLPGHLTPVERALALAEHAAASGEVDEGRKALQRLAIELRRAGEPELAGDARALAWSESAPSPARVRELADSVRSNGAR